MLKKIREYVKDTTIPLQKRCFFLTSITVGITLGIIWIWDIFIGESIEKLAVLGAGVGLMFLLVTFSMKFDKIELGGILISIGVIVFVLPVEYFTGGGIYGCTPIWFAFAFLYLGLNTKGIVRRVIIILLFACAVLCYLGSYFHPEWVTVHGDKIAHLDSIASVAGVGATLYLTVSFLMDIYNNERKIADKQKEEIEELNAAQNRFFSSMSHEIRTPINTIIGLNEMTLRENASDEINENSMNIQAASKMLLHLINDILDMSKFESGQMHLNEAAYHTGDMLSDIVGMLWLRAQQKGLEFHINVAQDLPEELLGDEVRIKQILINVLNNAIKYTSEGSVTLSIQCEHLENNKINVVYSVSDTGMGIKKESMPYLFTAFKRVDEEKNRYIEGTGLGLSIVKQFVDLMGGKITVNSVYKKGSTFMIEIPQKVISEEVIGDVDLERRHLLNKPNEYHQTFEAPNAKVLVVDDTAANLLVVEKLLRSTKVQLTMVGSGAEALQKTLETPFQVIFMDHMMPEMDGIECMHLIREQIGGLCKDAKIVALTANAGGDTGNLYAREGFDGYLIKPVNGATLESELFRLLPRDQITLIGSQDEILEESMSWIMEHRKKMPVVITTESVADLPKELIDRYRIPVLPHMVATSSGIFRDGLEIETLSLLAYMEDNKATVKTLAPDVSTHESFFAEQLTYANNVIHISISSQLTNSGCPMAIEASKAFDNVTVIDSGHLSSGQGLMVLEACRMAEEGKSVDEIVARIELIRDHIFTSFIVDSLDYLARSKQISARIASVTNAFMIRPVLALKKGKMVVGNIYLGARQRAWNRYISSILDHRSNIDHRVLFVTYVGMTQADLHEVEEAIHKRAQFDHIYFQKASPAIAVNCGPGTFGLLYMTLTGPERSERV